MAQVEMFPQQRATAAKPKLTLIEVIRGARTPEEMLPLAAAAFPDATMGELAATIERELKKLKDERARVEREAAGLEDIEALVHPVMESGEASKIGDALKILADRGDKRAAAYLMQLTSPELQEFWRLMDLAVASDPYWRKLPDGRGYQCQKGAVHDTPEKLVSAYRKSHGLD